MNKMTFLFRSTPLLLAIGTAFTMGACTTSSNISGGDNSSQGTLIATTNASSGTGQAFKTAGDAEGIARLRGQLYYVKDRSTTLLRGKQKVTRNLYLESNGDVTVADGRRIKLVEGYMVTFGGDVIEAPLYLR